MFRIMFNFHGVAHRVNDKIYIGREYADDECALIRSVGFDAFVVEVHDAT